ncbi:MAG: ferric iron uptake transcriptional regulator [Halofilum sp. (in: g-proteobacteria)]|nr:ferric iron uptake transcriptional regulator [Halofilum sp. (in: g-proteobacteria)]
MDHQELRDAGLKVTLPRIKVFEILQQNQGGDTHQHLTAEDIYRELIDAGSQIGLATVYRVLSQFEEAGLVHRHHFESGQAMFELARGKHHDHIVCVQCGKIEEFVDDVIEDRQQRIARQRDFDLADHSLVLYANCLRCDKDEKGGTGKR